MTAGSRARAGLGAIAALAVALAGCGSTTFSAEELVAEVNEHGGELALGEQLGDNGRGVEIHSLRLTGEGPAPADAHGGGSLLIAADDAAALVEFRRCEAAASLICFRAANAVLILEGAIGEVEVDRLARAIRAMAD